MAIVNMSYERTAYFIGCMSDCLSEDGISDEKRGRPVVSAHLRNAGILLYEGKKEVDEAWKVCKPYMKKKKK